MSKPRIPERSFEKCCQRFSRELSNVFQHPDCPDRIRDLIKLFTDELRCEYLVVMSIEAQAEEIRLGTLAGLLELSKAPALPNKKVRNSSND